MEGSLKRTAARKLLQLLQGEELPVSQCKDALFRQLQSEEALYEKRQGRSKGVWLVRDANYLRLVLKKRFGIEDLEGYLACLEKQEVTRGELTAVCGDSKAKRIRSFKGFLVNCYEPIAVKLGGVEQQLLPPPGTYLFVHDCDHFLPLEAVTVVGVENPENFRYIAQQRYLFTAAATATEHHRASTNFSEPMDGSEWIANRKLLFVSRYPQSQLTDLLEWLQSTQLPYLHYGDFDPAGISIFMNEYKKRLGDQARFFIPPAIKQCMQQLGNRERFDVQSFTFDLTTVRESALIELIALIKREQKGVDQEGLIQWIV